MNADIKEHSLQWMQAHSSNKPKKLKETCQKADGKLSGTGK
jgi:hypothetical protein